MRLRDHYDWIVLGDNPGALLSASLVSRLGLSALVIPIEPSLSISVSKTGQFFDPEPNYLLGLGWNEKNIGLVFECLTRLNIPRSEIELIGATTSLPQVITPDSRFVLDREEDLLFELSREFGKEVAQKFGLTQALKRTEAEYLEFWKNLPERLTLKPHPDARSKNNRKTGPQPPLTLRDLQRKLKTRLSVDAAGAPWSSSKTMLSDWTRALDSPDLENVCKGLWYAVTSSYYFEPALSDLLHICALSRTGGSFRGGMSAYREFLLKLAKRQGVHIANDADCRRIFVDHGRFAGVQISGRGNMVSTGGGILGCSYEKAYNRVTHTGRNWFHTKKKLPAPSGWRFTLSLAIEKDLVMPKMLPRAVWQEKDAPILEMELTSPSDYGAHSPNHKILHLRTIMPYEPESLKFDYQRIVAGRMVRQAMEIIPFLDHLLSSIYPDFRNRTRSKELTDLYGFHTLEDIPDNLLIFSGKGFGSSTGMEGLFIASEASYPSYGSMGPTVAAIEGVAWLAHRYGLSGPLV